MTFSPTIRIVLGFLAIALVLCVHVCTDQSAANSTAATPQPTRTMTAAVEQDLTDHFRVPFFSFAGLTAPRENPAL
jgi:type IV secretory pathway VirB2 component (pilin)